MASASSQEASSSTFQCSYQVFLSFRGIDTRKTFTGHLYTALVNAGIRTFRDDDELERGKNIETELRKAIQESKLSVIVLSKNYASSRYCLDELSETLKRNKTAKQTILPVFYHVDPSQVKKQTDSFAEAFAKHEEKFKSQKGKTKKEGMAKIVKWKAALREVSALGGMSLGDEQEDEFIQKVVKMIGSKLNRTTLNVPVYTVGTEANVKNINTWVQDGSKGVEILLICGLGGVGKTTIAKIVYNQNFERFDCSAFLANIREMSEQHNGLVRLQKLLLSYILKGRKVKIGCVDEGIVKIKDALCCQRNLIVLDDVYHYNQLNPILEMQDLFYPGSKIIITTRNEQLLKPHGLYRVKELSNDDSFQLFSWHAFGKNHPSQGGLDHSKKVVRYCGGLPFALEGLGRLLCSKRVDVWDSALKKIVEVPDSDIHSKLKTSYDFLDKHDQNLFLDIACFFIGKGEDDVILILEGCNLHPKVGIDTLVGRSLLKIDDYKHLQMHPLVQDLGTKIVREQSPEPGKRSRLWHHNDSLNVLREKRGTEKIEALALNFTEENAAAEAFVSTNNSKRKHTVASQDKLTLPGKNIAPKRRRLKSSWLPVNPASSTLCSTSNAVVLPTDGFSGMHNLRLLQLNNVELTGGFAEFPKKLRWLSWRGSTFKSIPNEFPLESLVALDMRNSCLEQVWQGTQVLRLLKMLDLSYSSQLTCTPAFSELPNLERLILKYCTRLTVVHESIGELGGLVLLNLKGCKKMSKLPRQICFLKCLGKLILSGCSSLDELPTELGDMVSLEVLHADKTTINKTLLFETDTIREVKSWSSVFWSSLSKPKRIPKFNFSLSSLPHSLKSLSLADCDLSDDAIADGIGSLSCLQQLNLDRNLICSIPESIIGLTNLQSVSLDHCMELQSLPELPMSLTVLHLHNCWSLQRVTNLPNLFRSLFFVAIGCEKLVEVPGLFKLEPLRNTDAEVIKYLRLSNKEFIFDVDVTMFNFLTLTERKVPLQVLYECGIFSTFIPGSEVPGLFSYTSMESFMCIKVPSRPNRKVQGLNICITYKHNSGRKKHSILEWWRRLSIKRSTKIKMSNETKNLKLVYSPTFVGIPRKNQDMMWLCHWKIGNLLDLEGGDEVNISAFLGEELLVKWFRVDFLYDEQELEGTQHSIYPPQNVRVGDQSAYQVNEGTFLLSNHLIKVHQEFSNDYYDILFGDSTEIASMNPDK